METSKDLEFISQSEYCELTEIGTSTLNEWKYRAENGCLENKTTVPKSFPQATPLEVVAEIIDTYFEYPEWGGQKLSDHLLNERILYASPGTAQKIKNRVNEELSSRGYELELMMRYEVLEPNDLWATDIIEFDWYGRTLYLMLLIDECSRFVLDWRISTSPTTELAVTLVEESMKEHGRPRAVKSDNGPQYRQTFESELVNRGINDLSSPPYYPQYNGTLERLNADIEEVVTRASKLDLQSISEALVH